ncbi:MAG: LysM peptidoglycan-binding domain-containing protein [Firmicutes bacterium]|nr:LysM peptidoglycan-binding domain-containing protein [Bacillota bacterium]
MLEKPDKRLEQQQPCGNCESYTLQEGENFYSVAEKYSLTYDQLAALNAHLEDPTVVGPGDVLKVPAPEVEEVAEVQAEAQQAVVCPPGTFRYTVQPGDSMFLIARRFGVSLDALIAANPQIQNPALIFPGQIVCVPTSPAPPPPVCPPGTFRYTVRPGDSMFLIAQRFGVSLNALIAANPQISNPSLIFPGQVICVPSAPPTTCPPGTFRYTVQPGDTMFTIAQRFGVSLNALIAANPQIPNPNRITPGQIICVPTR